MKLQGKNPENARAKSQLRAQNSRGFTLCSTLKPQAYVKKLTEKEHRHRACHPVDASIFCLGISFSQQLLFRAILELSAGTKRTTNELGAEGATMQAGGSFGPASLFYNPVFHFQGPHCWLRHEPVVERARMVGNGLFCKSKENDAK